MSSEMKNFINILLENEETRSKTKTDPLEFTDTSSSSSQGDLEQKSPSDITVNDIKKADKNDAKEMLQSMLQDPDYRKHATSLLQKLPNDFFNRDDEEDNYQEYEKKSR